jgi:hypothetical protein
MEKTIMAALPKASAATTRRGVWDAVFMTRRVRITRDEINIALPTLPRLPKRPTLKCRITIAAAGRQEHGWIPNVGNLGNLGNVGNEQSSGNL